MRKTYCFACFGLLFFCLSSALGADYEPPEARVPELRCVAATTSISYEVGHQLLDVELVNNCSKDITAFDLRITGASGTNAAFSAESSYDYLYTLRMKLPPSSGRFDVTDILRSHSRIALRFRDLEGGTAAPVEAYLTSAIFSDFTSAGDPKHIERRLAYRRASLRSLRRISEAIGKISELETARALFRPGSCSPGGVEQAQTADGDDPLYERFCENVVFFSKSLTPEKWKKYIAEYKAEVDKGILAYVDHTDRVQVGDQVVKENQGEP